MYSSSNSAKNISSDLEVFFKQHYRTLCFAANNILHDHDAAQDVVQDVFVMLLRRKKKILINSTLKGYIFKATINTALNSVKKSKNTLSLVDEVLDAHHYTGIIGENSLEHLELEENINQAINLLPPKCKAVFLLNRYQDMKYREVAEHLGISIKTVENQMGKALKRLRNQLKSHIVRKSSITS